MMEVDAMKDLEEEIEFESEQPNQEKMIITKSRGLPKLLRWSHAFRSDQKHYPGTQLWSGKADFSSSSHFFLCLFLSATLENFLFL